MQWQKFEVHKYAAKDMANTFKQSGATGQKHNIT